jgi:hypothetical protein
MRSVSIVRVLKPRTLRWAGYVGGRGYTRNIEFQYGRLENGPHKRY